MLQQVAVKQDTLVAAVAENDDAAGKISQMSDPY